MARKVTSKMKLGLVLLIGVIIGGATLLYQKLFGGKVETLPTEESMIDLRKQKPTASVQKKVEEIVAVTRAEVPAEGVVEVIKRTGNLGFIKEGQKVLIKPNVNSDDAAPGTTHPEALAEVVRLTKARGAYVIVGDRSNPRWKTIPAMKKTGIYQAASDAGADEIIGFEEGDWIRVNPEKAQNWPKGFRIPKILKEVDHIISVPVLHTHSITGHSLAIKNLVGLIHPTDRMIFHASSKIEEMIAEIGLAVKPSLTLIEGTKAFIKGGPSHGTLVTPKLYLASKDSLAADVVGFELLKKEGASHLEPNVWDSQQIKRVVELGLSAFSRQDVQKELEKIILI